MSEQRRSDRKRTQTQFLGPTEAPRKSDAEDISQAACLTAHPPTCLPQVSVLLGPVAVCMALGGRAGRLLFGQVGSDHV
jgi:hypothetical protein